MNGVFFICISIVRLSRQPAKRRLDGRFSMQYCESVSSANFFYSGANNLTPKLVKEQGVERTRKNEYTKFGIRNTAQLILHLCGAAETIWVAGVDSLVPKSEADRPASRLCVRRGFLAKRWALSSIASMYLQNKVHYGRVSVRRLLSFCPFPPFHPKR